MSRLPYLAVDVAEPADVVQPIRERRGGTLFNLDRMLLHSPPFAQGWNVFLGTVRRDLALSPRLRELAICVVAVVNRADYELAHHAPEYAAAGANEDQVAALSTLDDAAADVSMFEPAERVVIEVTQALTRNATLSANEFAAAAEVLENEQELVELIGVIAAYNMVSRFLNAFDIEPE